MPDGAVPLVLELSMTVMVAAGVGNTVGARRAPGRGVAVRVVVVGLPGVAGVHVKRCCSDLETAFAKEASCLGEGSPRRVEGLRRRPRCG